MDFERLSIDLTEIVHDGVIFVRANLPLIDFTKPFQGVLEVFGPKRVVSIDLSDETTLITLSYLLTNVFDEKLLIISWNIKEIISYFKFFSKNFEIISKIVDLRLLESFCGIVNEAPASLSQAVKRMKEGFSLNPKAKLIADKIHRPLATKVIPALETQSILDTELKKRVYPFYDIEQQVNGRLKGSKPFITAINTHNLTDAEKDKLKLRSEEEFFVYFDFNSMEVAVLQFLAQDERLKSMLLGDCYRNIWSELFHSNCDTAQQRKFIKDSFLPLIFGGGNVAIMEATGCSEKTVISLRNKLRDNFPKSFNFVENCQNLIVEDYFGRKREFSEDKLYIAKNFVIQAPAAIICMEKLIELYFIAGDKLLFSIHDGYVIRCNPKTDKPLIMECKKVLESPSKLAEGLQLTVTCQLGAKLNRMRSINV